MLVLTAMVCAQQQVSGRVQESTSFPLSFSFLNKEIQRIEKFYLSCQLIPPCPGSFPNITAPALDLRLSISLQLLPSAREELELEELCWSPDRAERGHRQHLSAPSVPGAGARPVPGDKGSASEPCRKKPNNSYLPN